MIHPGGFTTLVLALLDAMIGLDSDCLIGDGLSNITTEAPDGVNCLEAFNYTSQYCQCSYATMNKTHDVIQAARNSSITFADTEDLQDMDQAVLLVKEVLYTSAEIFANIRNCTGTPHSCLTLYEEKKNREKNYTDTFHQLQVLLDMARTSQNILTYYMPAVIAVVFIFGMIGNSILLFIFYKHSETRSGPKILLVSLAVSDILLLLFNYFGKYFILFHPFTLGINVCQMLTFLAIAPARASVLSIMVLSIIRYFAVTAMPGDRSHKLLDHMPVVVALVWTAASLQAIQHIFEAVITKYDFSDKTYCDLHMASSSIIVMLITTCILPFIIIGFFTVATHRRLRQGAQRSRRTELDKVKERNAKILPALAILFTITYPPLYIFWFIATLYGFALSSTLIWFFHLTQLLLNINPALNPVVLYLSSGMFREYFQKYLRFQYKKKPKENKQNPEDNLNLTDTAPC